MAVLWKELLYATFDPLGAAASGIKVDRLEYLFLALVALTIVVSLQAVGIILVVAMLITPAATAQLLTVRFTRLMVLAALDRHRQRHRRPLPVLLARRRERRHHRAGPDLAFVLALVLGPRGCWPGGARQARRPMPSRAWPHDDRRHDGTGAPVSRRAPTPVALAAVDHAGNHLVRGARRAPATG